jgi:GDP-L-fucose synthase
VEDLARAACDMAESENTGLYNVGYGSDVSIAELAGIIAAVVGYDGPIEWDTSRADGTPRKLLDSQKIRAIGWRPEVRLEEGVRRTYDWFRRQSTEPSQSYVELSQTRTE